MSLTLYFHPLASYCHKVLIALYESGTPFTPRLVDLSDPGSSAEMLARWPVGKMPVLHDAATDRAVPETSIIIEYLQQHYPGPVALLPDDRDAGLQARLWDRFFDLYVSGPMQAIVGDRIRPAGVNNDPHGVAQARASLETAYAAADAQLRGRSWAIGETFSMADCAAAPALFYATILQPLADRHPHLAAYVERLMARPSVVRVIDEARPWFANFPFVDAMPARFRNG